MDPSNLAFGFPGLPGHGHMPIPPTANMLGAHGHPAPTASPPQSVPGRRTPLGSVGLGGFYAQGMGMSQQQQQTSTDENKPGPSAADKPLSPTAMAIAAISGGTTTAAMSSIGSALSGGPGGSGANGGKQKNRQGKTVRLNINARERRRMHDLNDALDELRR
ncbi:GH23918 [Drosophila grimshawi]|uniref:GH23918 n=1 Tax=Drosophila grimshawi TaxID=7222 RepID=B4K4B9_DROGR|nr:GH23918 [Drosophila grimshawi]